MRSSESNKDEKESREEVSLSAESEVANSCSLLAETTPPELHQVKTQAAHDVAQQAEYAAFVIKVEDDDRIALGSGKGGATH